MIKSIIFLSLVLFCSGLIAESHQTHVSKPVLSIDKTQYKSGDTVVLSGWVNYDNSPTSDVLLQIVVTDPLGAKIFEGYETSKEDGTFFTEFSIPDNSISGTYKIDVISQCREVHRDICTNQSEFLTITIEGVTTDVIKNEEPNKIILSPLKQVNQGIPITEIICKENLELIFKATNGSPACVKPESIQKLIERGWTVP